MNHLIDYAIACVESTQRRIKRELLLGSITRR